MLYLAFKDVLRCAFLLVLCSLTACINSAERITGQEFTLQKLPGSSFSFFGKKANLPPEKEDAPHAEDVKFLQGRWQAEEDGQKIGSLELNPGCMVFGTFPAVRIPQTLKTASNHEHEDIDTSTIVPEAYEATKQIKGPFQSNNTEADNRKKKMRKKINSTKAIASLMEIRGDMESRLSNAQAQPDPAEKNVGPSQYSEALQAFSGSHKPADHADERMKGFENRVSIPRVESETLDIGRNPGGRTHAQFNLMIPSLARGTTGHSRAERGKSVKAFAETNENDKNHPHFMISFGDHSTSQPLSSKHEATQDQPSCTRVRNAFYELGSKFAREKIPLTVLKMIMEHLQLSNQQEHLGLSDLNRGKSEIYQNFRLHHPQSSIRLLMVLVHYRDDYEVLRRHFTFLTQHAQHEAPQLWKQAKAKAIVQKIANLDQLDRLENELLLNVEYPNPVLYPDNFYTELLDQDLGTSGNNVRQFLFEAIGAQECLRRYGNPEYSSRSSLKQLPSYWLEEMRRAERSHAVNIWKLHQMIKYLGLGTRKKFELCDPEEVWESFEEVQKAASESDIFFFGWYHSPSRAWLIKKFRDKYYQNLESLCYHASKCDDLRSYKSHTEGWKQSVSQSSNSNGNVLKVGDRLLFQDMGISSDLLMVIQRLKTSKIDQSWDDIFHQSEYLKLVVGLDSNQKHFLKNWVVRNFKR